MPKKFEYEVDGRSVSTDDRLVYGREVRTSAGLDPASDYVLVRTDGGYARSVGLEEEVRFEKGERPVFRSFRSDRVSTFTVDERGWEWGADAIAEPDIRAIAGIGDAEVLVLDSDGDRPIERGSELPLSPEGVERVRSERRPPTKVTIRVNSRRREVEPGAISFEQLVALAFQSPPSGPNVAFTVSWRKGPADRPEGSLVSGQSVDVVEGMTFHFTATDKS